MACDGFRLTCCFANELDKLHPVETARQLRNGCLGHADYDSCCSPKVIGDNVMLTVATSDLIAGPTRLLFPRMPGGVGEASGFPFSLLGESSCQMWMVRGAQSAAYTSALVLRCPPWYYSCGSCIKAAASMTGWARTLGWLCSSAVHRCAAGLGDVAVPGLLACLALRYDASRAVNMRSRAEAASAAISEVLADLDVSLFGTLHGSSPPLCRWQFLFAKPAAFCLSLCPRKACRDFCASPLLCLPAASPVWQADGRCQCQGCRCCL